MTPEPLIPLSWQGPLIYVWAASFVLLPIVGIWVDVRMRRARRKR